MGAPFHYFMSEDNNTQKSKTKTSDSSDGIPSAFPNYYFKITKVKAEDISGKITFCIGDDYKTPKIELMPKGEELLSDCEYMTFIPNDDPEHPKAIMFSCELRKDTMLGSATFDLSQVKAKHNGVWEGQITLSDTSPSKKRITAF